MPHYLSFLLDLGAERENRAIPDSVRHTPDPSIRPTSAFHWKVVCDAAGTISIRADVKGKLTLIAASAWGAGGLGELRQREANVPTGPQWGFVAAAIEAELAKRIASGALADPSLLDPISDVEASYLLGADISKLDTTFRYNEPVKEPPKPRTGLTLPWIALGVAMIACTVFVMWKRDRAKTASPPVAAAPPTPEPSVTPPVEDQIAAAPTFAAAIALAKHDPMLLARYGKLTWAEVDGAAETSIGHVQKDAEAERGKRMCAEGVIEKIERKDLDRRKVFIGRLRQADGDVIAFTALGTTGDLIKRAPAKFCGAVTGIDGDAVLLVGLFDLPENRTPLVEQ